MQLFVLTLHCQSHAHCRVCRNLKGGRAWRKSIAKSYELPQAKPEAVDVVDFECPYGLPWTNDVQDSKPITAQLAKAPVVQTPLPRNVIQRDSGSLGERKGCGCSKNR